MWVILKNIKAVRFLYAEAVRYILDIPKFTKKHSLDHTRELMKALGNPQESLKVIHVGGTNGKGSVCAMMDSILRAGGKRTGMFTSPHLVRMEERIRVDGREIEKEEFCRIFQQVLYLRLCGAFRILRVGIYRLVEYDHLSLLLSVGGESDVHSSGRMPDLYVPER